MHPKLRRLIKLTQTKTQAGVRIQKTLAEEFEVRPILNQGNPLSTSLFNLCMEYAIRKIKIHPRGTIFNRTCQSFAIADNLVLLARN